MDNQSSTGTGRTGPVNTSEHDTVRILGSDSSDEPLRAYTPVDRGTSMQRADSEWLPGPVADSRTEVNPPPQTVVVKRGPSTCAVVAGIVGVLLLACLLLTYATVREGLSGFGKITGFIPSLGFLGTPTVTIDTSRPSVVERVQAMSKLETVHYQIEKVISGKSSGPLPAPLMGDKILLVAHGDVAAGIDLSKVRPQDVDEVGTAVTLTLPAPEILFSKLDNSKTYVYDRQTGIFSKPDPNLESQIRASAEEQIVQAATEDGILTQATQNAEQTLRTLLEGLGYRQVNFKEGP
jgi:Protein of unknown function (DUF4230)